MSEKKTEKDILQDVNSPEQKEYEKRMCEPENPEESSEPCGKGTFIIMDDDEFARDSISDMLMAMGYDVIHMEQGEEVVSYFRDGHTGNDEISGIILDLVIPGGMGGKAAAIEIGKIIQDIPVFAISGYTDDPVMLNPVEHGFTASLCKPFVMPQLSEMLKKYLH
jgi:CheY-like chemotaxis protein